MDDRQTRGLREYIQRWRLAGPALEEQHRAELAALDEASARRSTADLFRLWRPPAVDECGAEMVTQQAVFRRLWERERSRP